MREATYSDNQVLSENLNTNSSPAALARLLKVSGLSYLAVDKLNRPLGLSSQFQGLDNDRLKAIRVLELSLKDYRETYHDASGAMELGGMSSIPGQWQQSYAQITSGPTSRFSINQYDDMIFVALLKTLQAQVLAQFPFSPTEAQDGMLYRDWTLYEC